MKLGSAGASRSDSERRRHGQAQALQGKGIDLTSGARMSAIGEREGESGERRNSEEKAYSEECTKGGQDNWAGREAWWPAREGWTDVVDWVGSQLRFK
jgi:hypothetical protein